MMATLSQRGQVTIPKSCRDKLGLKTGDAMDFEVRDGVLLARRVQPEDVFRKWRGRGRLPAGVGVDEYLGGVRG